MLKPRLTLCFLLFYAFCFAQTPTFTGSLQKNKPSKALEKQFLKYEIYQIDVIAFNAYVKAKKDEIPLKLQLGDQHHWDLMLLANDMRSDDYIIRVNTENGEIRLPRGENIAFKGYQGTNDKIRLAIADNFISGFVEDNGENYYIEPLDHFEKGSARDLFVVYAGASIIPDPTKKCGAELMEQYKIDHQDPPSGGIDPATEMLDCYEVEIAIANDWAMFLDYGSNNTNVINQNIAIMNGVQANYDDEFNWELLYVITEHYISSCSTCDPWSATTNAGTLLNSFTNWGNGGNFTTTFDVASLWTNRDFNGGTVGIAWLSGICNGNRYHCLQDYTGNFNSLRQMTSHELGHNWGRGHNSPNAGCIMDPVINGSACWSGTSQTVINNFASGLIGNCLSTCAGGAAPTAAFSADVTEGCVPFSVNYFDGSSGATSWNWTFEGGTPATSNDQNPTVTYLTQGTYDVSLEVFNSIGSNLLTETDYVTVNDVPTANFTSAPVLGQVQFFNSSTNALGYFWDFGDGNTSIEENPVHEYLIDGLYTVTLTASNECGDAIFVEQILIVLPPVASFEAAPTMGCAPLTVTFIDNSSANTEAWFWNFEGGTPMNSSDQFPEVTFTTPGVFDVTLEVFNAAGSDLITFTDYIVVNDVPTADFTFSQTLLTVDFTNNSTGSFSYLWDFGDGNSSMEENPSHTYADDGTYEVNLTTINECGTTVSTQSLLIASPPAGGFTASVTQGCSPLTVQFTDQSSSNVVTWNWTFVGGEPETSNEENPVVIYNTPGVYDVVLEVFNSAGNSMVSEVGYIDVAVGPQAAFTSSTIGTLVDFTNSSSNATSYSWDFGDGNDSTEENPSHDYTTDGTYIVELTATNDCGSITSTETVVIVTAPEAGFTASITTGCAPLSVDFTDESSENTVSWAWTFEGGSPAISSAQNPTVTFNDAGTYTVTLMATNSAGMSTATETNYIVVNEEPIVDFSSSTTGTTVDFTNSSSNATSYSWDFGDGNDSTDENPSHTYSTDGSYTVELTATNECGSVTTTETVVIVTAPEAGFTSSVTSGCAPLEVVFTDQSSENTVSWVWTFEGGSPATSNAQNPTVTFNDAGTYSVTLVATNSAGMSTALETNYIVVNEEPTAGFSSSTTGTTVDFTNSSSNATTYSWDFDDGNGSTDENPSHTYSSDGTYTVELTATNECGSVTTTETVVIVTAPEAGFTSNVTSGCAPLEVDFTDESSENTVSWAWTFEGGSPATSSAQNPTVSFNDAGTYNVTLVATNSAGMSTATETNYIVVNEEPTADFSSSTTGTTVDFTNSSSNANSYSWDFGDGNDSTDENPSHDYETDGTYTVELTATNECGSVTTTETVVIVTVPEVGFTSSVTSGCTPLEITFTDQSSENTTSWSWSFPGGTPSNSTAQNPTVTYNNIGIYSVTLVATNSAGMATVTETDYIVVNTTPTASFTENVNGAMVDFNNNSNNATSYSWDFGDGNDSTDEDPTHTYANDGVYTVELTATNECGSVTTTEVITVVTNPEVGFTASVTSGCAPLAVQFTDLSSSNTTGWSWTFAGGTPASSTMENPLVTYNAPGTYSVTLEVTNAAGGATAMQMNYIVVNTTPTAGFNSTINGTTVDFNNTSDNATTYSWDFGDGNNSVATNPTYNYAGDGTYEVTLSATNECGTVTTTETLLITTTPQAGFTASATSGCSPFEVAFTDQSSANTTDWTWTFEGGTPATSTAQNPVVTYANVGNYSVTLIASNAAGNSTVMETNFISVGVGPTVGFNSEINDLMVSFINLSNNVDTYSWDFGDGNGSTEASPDHSYTMDGVYEVSLTVTNECGSETTTETLTIVTPPTPGFTSSVTSGCVPLEIQFTDESSENTSNWTWTFEGGTPATSTSQNPMIQYNVAGTYAVTLEVSNAAGSNSTTIAGYVQVGEGPTSMYTHTTSGNTAVFSNDATNALTYSWDFGDGNNSTSINPTHTYELPGTYTVVLTATNECGSVMFTDDVLIEGVAPLAGFTSNTTVGCAPLSVQFEDLSSASTTAWSWTFEGGTPATSSMQDPLVVFETPGVYTVSLEAISPGGSDVFTEVGYIIVLDSPEVGFNTDVNGTSVNFENTSSNANSFAWDFGDGNMSNEENPVHNYMMDGEYTVTLMATNDCGSVTTTSLVVVVTTPTAGFVASTTNGCAPMTVQFTDQSSANTTNWAWTFEGGTPATSTEQNPVVVYNTAGVYSVQLDASNSAGSNNMTQANLIVVESTPTPAFTSGTNGTEVTFVNSSINAVTYSWDFGDGNGSTDENPIHTYAMDGTYDVVLTATNACGTVEVSNLVTVTVLPIAGFSANVTSGCAPMTVQFLDQSTVNTTNWSWSFPGGEPSTSTAQNPIVIYSTPGVYDVTLAASNSAGSNSTTQLSFIVVEESPVAGFSNMISDWGVDFSNTSSSSITGNTYSWDFGDGNMSTEENPIHNYATGGTYMVSLTTTNACGSNTIVQTIELLAVPVADFTANVTSGCAPFEVAFTDASSENTTSWNWTFEGGEPTSSTDQNPTVIYNTPGVYNVTLVATNSVGSDEIIESSFITVNTTPTTGFTFEANGMNVDFMNTSDNATTYSWDFGDGNESTEVSPVHAYLTAGTYTVVLTATNECGTTTFESLVDILTSIEETDLLEAFTIFPNPNNGRFTLLLKGEAISDLEISLINVLGQILDAERLDFDGNLVKHYDRSTLAAGTYIVQLRAKDAVMYRKVVIN